MLCTPCSWILSSYMSGNQDVSTASLDCVSTTQVLHFSKSTGTYVLGHSKKRFTCVSYQHTRILSICIWVQKYFYQCHAHYLGKVVKVSFETCNIHDRMKQVFHLGNGFHNGIPAYKCKESR